MIQTNGFTLIEVLVVMAIIAILSMIALPSKTGVITRTQITESIKLVEDYKAVVALVYKSTGDFPMSNDEAGLPAAEKIKGNYVTRVDINHGGFHIVFGAKIRGDLAGKILSIRPIYVEDSLNSPISWICGNDSVPDGMSVSGENNTDIDLQYLPIRCR
ncbi:pilin [bacterium AH-315-K03]|nr:pilin [bacterium AH-315-K03]